MSVSTDGMVLYWDIRKLNECVPAGRLTRLPACSAGPALSPAQPTLSPPVLLLHCTQVCGVHAAAREGQ
jgi:hypothetical protein